MKAALFTLAAGLSLALPSSLFADDKIDVVQKVAPNVYFHQGDLDKGHCNQGWILFKDYVLVVDGNFPSRVKVVLPKIKGTTDKPIKFVVDTHHHGDHAYGNMAWFEIGAIPVASNGALAEMKKKRDRLLREASHRPLGVVGQATPGSEDQQAAAAYDHFRQEAGVRRWHHARRMPLPRQRTHAR